MILAKVKDSDRRDSASRVPSSAGYNTSGLQRFRSTEQAAGTELCGVVHGDERHLSRYQFQKMILGRSAVVYFINAYPTISRCGEIVIFVCERKWRKPM